MYKSHHRYRRSGTVEVLLQDVDNEKILHVCDREAKNEAKKG